MNTVQDAEKIEQVGIYYDQLVDAHYNFLDFWMQNTLFHWDFWLSWLLTIVPWILWFRFRKKDSTHRLLFAAFFVIFISLLLDFVGTVYGLWYYTGKALPLMPAFMPWDLTLLPVFAMSLIQVKPHLSPVIKAFLFTGACSLVGEPLFLWLGLYVIRHWSIWYSVPIYFLIYWSAHKLSTSRQFSPIS